MSHIGLWNCRGKKLTWKWNKSYSKLTTGDGKGVDWYHYTIYILKRKLIPFT